MNDGLKADVLRDGRISPEISLKGSPDTSPPPVLPGGKPFEQGRMGFNGFVLDFQRGCLLDGDQEVPIRPKTYEVLGYLVRNQGRLVSKEELMKAVWPGVIVTEDSLFQCIAELRRAFAGRGEGLITTIQRRGYRFEGDTPGQSGAAPGQDMPRLPGQPPGAIPGATGRKRIFGIVVMAALVAFGLMAHKWWLSPEGRSAVAAPVSIVVLPFRSLSQDPQSDTLAVGLSVELTSDLFNLPGAVVISPATAHALSGSPVDIKQIGHDLNVRYVVQGTVARSEKDIRINIQLVDAATGQHVWADRQVRAASNMPSWQDEVVGGIASALNFKLARLESERVLRERPRNPEVYDLTTRGWAMVYTAKRSESYQSALALFREALDRDPKAVNALAGVGWVSILSVLNGWSRSPAEDVATARRAADQLLAIDPNNVVAHHVRGASLRFEKNTEAARDEFLTAIALSPNFANSHAQLGRTHIELGSPEEGIRSLERAMRLSPRDPNVGHWMANTGMAYLHMQRIPEAVAWLRRSHEIATSSPTLLHRNYLVSALALAGRTEETRAALKALQGINPDASITSLRQITRSTNAQYVKQLEPLYKGLRLAGLPE